VARSLKYEEVYLNAYASVAEAKAGIGAWFGFYNEERQHQSLGYRTPRQVYEAECPWICGRSASPSGCAFAHILTGTTTNHRIDVDEKEHRSNAMTVATSAIGADTEIGREEIASHFLGEIRRRPSRCRQSPEEHRR